MFQFVQCLLITKLWFFEKLKRWFSRKYHRLNVKFRFIKAEKRNEIIQSLLLIQMIEILEILIREEIFYAIYQKGNHEILKLYFYLTLCYPTNCHFSIILKMLRNVVFNICKYPMILFIFKVFLFTRKPSPIPLYLNTVPHKISSLWNVDFLSDGHHFELPIPYYLLLKMHFSHKFKKHFEWFPNIIYFNRLKEDSFLSISCSLLIVYADVNFFLMRFKLELMIEVFDQVPIVRRCH